MSNAGSPLRLGGFIACIVGLAACAQGIQSEGLTDDGSAGAFSSGGRLVGASGALGSSPGSPALGGATGGAGRANGGSSSGGKGGAPASGGKSGTAGVAGSAVAGGAAAGAGTGPQGCSHPQPGEDVGLAVQYKADSATASVPYLFFTAQIDSPEADSIQLSELELRYYFTNDLTSPMVDIYSPQIKHKNTTDNVSAGDVKTSFTPTYLEVSFTSTAVLLKGESLTFQAHFSSSPVVNHDQTNDYSWNAGGALAPNCKIALFRGESNALAWGTPPP